MIHYQWERETKIKKYQKETDNSDSLLASQKRVNTQKVNKLGQIYSCTSVLEGCKGKSSQKHHILIQALIELFFEKFVLIFIIYHIKHLITLHIIFHITIYIKSYVISSIIYHIIYYIKYYIIYHMSHLI